MRIRSIRAVLFAFVVLVMSAASFGQIRISVRFGPPPLPVYEQPLCPGDGYIWTPGYWAWSDDDGDYYWVPGTWILAPEVGFLWTPPYWGWEGGVFLFHEGYWGPHVGFYGGINYGFGYFGDGFAGGRWDSGHFFYNRSVTNVNVTNIHNVYNETVINNTTVVNRVSYNGGEGGITRRPTPQEENAQRERHIPPAAAQNQQVQAARENRELRASANHGRPPVAATARPGEFSGREAVPAREAGGAYNPPAKAEGGDRNGGERRAEPGGGNAPPPKLIHPRDIPQGQRPAPPNTGNQQMDKRYQQQQEKLQQKQDQERQKLQAKQDQDHQRLTQQKANDARQQQLEQKHQQQTQQLQQRHEQQQQKLQQRQMPVNRPREEPPKKPQ